MSVGFQAVQWNRFKILYDLVLWAGAIALIAVFIVTTNATQAEGESFHPVQLVLRAFGLTAVILLFITLAIGPLARLSDRFKPLLYNRRHMGVTVFFFALIHAGLVLMWYHGFSETNVFVSLLATNPNYDRIYGFPFEALGLAALLILFVMAATSHDFWLDFLGAPVWKLIHMLVYPAYALLVGHLVLGALQDQSSIIGAALVCGAAFTLVGLHLLAGWKEARDDKRADRPVEEGWLDAGDPDDIPDGRAVMIAPEGGERIAVFRDGDTIAALSSVCRHQNGPLGEGHVKDGCVVCPWHGWEYRLEDGRAPAPFTEKIATYPVRLVEGRVQVSATPLPPGTYSEPVTLSGSVSPEGAPT
jgi:sulfoxide reductase heme-binding subunit YedZ